eukprot:787827-Prorocentrum_minimum.AAC.2
MIINVHLVGAKIEFSRTHPYQRGRLLHRAVLIPAKSSTAPTCNTGSSSTRDRAAPGCTSSGQNDATAKG